MRTSLRSRLTINFIVIIAATAGLISILASVVLENRFNYYISVKGQNIARRLEPMAAEYYQRTGSWDGLEKLITSAYQSETSRETDSLLARRFPRLYTLLNRASAEWEEERILIFDSDNHLVVDSNRESGTVHLLPAAAERGTPIMVDGKSVGRLVVASTIGGLTATQKAFLREVNRVLILTFILASLLGVCVAVIESRRITAPIRALVQAAHRIAAGDLTQRIPIKGSDELTEMAESFNQMAEQLEQQHQLRRRAMSDIAHELRTPLSVLQIELESIEDGLSDPSPETIAGLKTEVSHLNHLVEDLRTLALAEAGDLKLEKQRLDLNTFIPEVVSRVQTSAREKEITLSLNPAPETLPANADPQRIAQIMLNLLSNAIQHTPAHGSIQVQLSRENQSACIQVCDNGEGISAEDLPCIFERLYRADPARNRNHGGSGLGLSIVRSLVEAHGGSIRAESQPGQGSTFIVHLPLAD